MWLHLIFSCGKIRGLGGDAVGKFVMFGSYSLRTGRVSIRKHYYSQHMVWYEGAADATRCPSFLGHWHLPSCGTSGLWRMWPKGMEEGGGEALAEVYFPKLIARRDRGLWQASESEHEK